MTPDQHRFDLFLTGGTGLLGSHFLNAILKFTDWKVKALRRPTSSMELAPDHERIQWVTGDLQDVTWLIAEMSECRNCVHAAGRLSVSSNESDMLKKANVRSTANIVNASLESSVQRFLHVSSVASLGREHAGLVNEKSEYVKHPLNTHYSDSKHAADLEVYRGEAEGLNVSLIRPSLILGSGHWEGGSDGVVKKAHTGVPFYPAGGTGLVDVRDVADMMIRMLQADDFSFDMIANGHNVSFLELQEKLATYLDRPGPKYELKNWMIPAIAMAEKVRSWLMGKKSIISIQSLKRSQMTYYYDNSRSADHLNFSYRELDDTLKACSEAFLSYKRTGSKSLLPV